MVCYECEEERKRWRSFNKVGLCVSIFATFVAVWLLVRYELAPKSARLSAAHVGSFNGENDADAAANSTPPPNGAPPAPNVSFKERLGRASWTFLHLLASHYPQRPSKAEMQAFQRFLHYFVRSYTCKVCADEFAKIYRANPPTANSRAELILWLCRVHNLVNRRLNKTNFECSLQALEARWH